MHNTEERHWVRNGLYVALLFMLLREWVLPLVELSEITEIYRIEPFLLAIFLFLLLQYVRCPFSLSIVLNMVISLALMAHYFHYGSALDALWWEQLFSTIGSDVQFVLGQEWVRLSGELRTFLFLFGWSLLIYAIYALLSERQTISWFVGATLLYLLFLQYVWGLDTSSGIWRTAVGGGVLLIVSRSAKLTARSDGKVVHHREARDLTASDQGHVDRSAQAQGSWKAIAVGVCVFACASGVAAWLSVAATAPEPIVMTFAQQTVSKTGYGHDDSQLGRSLQQDHQIAFFANTDQLTYWKGETKSFYDGSGWHERHANEVSVTELLELSSESMADEWMPISQEVHVEHPSLSGTLLFRGGSRVTIHELKGEQRGNIALENVFYDDSADRYVLAQGVRARSYKLTTYLPKVDLGDRVGQADQSGRDSHGGEASQTGQSDRVDLAVNSDDSQDGELHVTSEQPDRQMHTDAGQAERDGSTFTVGDPYLQLPFALPERVRELARDIVGDLEDPYEIAKAIEQHLRSHYTYTLEHTEIPGARRDFVDHFLFEQKQGYCDHFSTSMVILLRTLDIPARWVKGFTPGEVVSGSGDGSGYEVIVRNSNAHSWVEAYIPEYGWLPFEPTPGFSADGLLRSYDEAALPTMSSELEDGDEARVEDRSRLAEWLQSPRVWLGGLMTVAGIFMLAFVWDVLRRFRLLVAVIRLRFCTTSEAAKQALALLWQRWFELHGQKAGDQTLREYVRHLQPKSAEQRAAMEAFLEATEQIHYGHVESMKLLRKRLGTNWRKGCE